MGILATNRKNTENSIINLETQRFAVSIVHLMNNRPGLEKKIQKEGEKKVKLERINVNL